LIRRFFDKYRTLLIITASVLLVWLYRAPLLNVFRLFADREALQTTLQQVGGWGPAIVALLILIQTFIAFIPGYLLVAVSGYIYGAPWTIAIIATSSVVSSQLAFLLARAYGRPLIYRLASGETIEKWNKIAGDRGSLFYFFMFVLPFIPSDLMCYVAGLGKISARSFFIANLTGRLWATTETAILSAYGFQPPPIFWVLLVLSLAGLYAGWLIYNKISRASGN
jgi:uncharacterized membrane protein YdjX (TVP38/TMEM64 family)